MASVAVAPHDLRNPLATIKGTAQLLQRTMSKGEAVTPERLSHSLETLVSSVNHAISQVTELLDVARVRLGSPLTLDLHPTDMAAFLACVFERFRRGANAAAIDGSGVGLAAAKHIVEQHGGTIELTSAEGHGTTVTVRMPVTQA